MEQQNERHDGTSPLPFAMDWSHPFEWNGRDTAWPHDSHIGWRYCVTLPNWFIAPQATDMDPVLFYRVQVGLQSPKGITTTRTIFRKYNDFLELRATLRNMFPTKNLQPIPPKQTTSIRAGDGNFLKKQRQTIEDWTIRLLSDLETSRSMVVATFFELQSAAISSFRDENQQISANGMSLNSDLTDALERLDTHGTSSINQGLSMGYTNFEQVNGSLTKDESSSRGSISPGTGFNCLSSEKEPALKDYLTTKVKDLEEELETAKWKSRENLKQAILETEKLTQMQCDMDELQRKLLDMELKLESQQKQLQQEKQISEKEKADRMKLIHDCESLHNRLFECRANLLHESADSICNNSSSLHSAFKLLQISDSQIEILLAEAHFLLQDDKQKVSAVKDISKAEDCGTAVDYELKKVLSRILIDNITLRKTVSSVVRYALKLSSLTGKDDAEVPARKLVFGTYGNLVV